MIKYLKYLFLTSIIVYLSGCTYFDNVRQQELNAALQNHSSFQQRPETTIAPASYYVCGDVCYPCQEITPIGSKPVFHIRKPVKHIEKRKHSVNLRSNTCHEKIAKLRK